MSRFIRIYLFAIALPAVLLAFLGARLLAQGAAWQRDQAAEGGALRAERVAQRFGDDVRELLDARLDRIAAAPDEDARLRTLRSMAGDDPFVRNVFVWRPGEGIAMPRREGAPAAERRFLDRLSQLLAGPAPWSETRAHAASRGLHPWQSGGRPELLAWVRTANGEIAGVEFETFAWLARVAAAPGASVSIAGESGETIVPAAVEPAAGAAAGEAPLAPLFPPWRVRVAPAAGAAAGGGARFATLGGVLFGLLLCSLVAGGAVLLRAARRERRDAMRKTEFVSNVSHELRTPLTSIRMYSELLAEDRIAGTERRRRALGTIAAESIRLSRLVNGVLDFSRLEQNRRKYDLEPVDLAALAREIAGEAGRPAPAAGADPAPALADRDAVRQIVLNLLDNAAKYAPGAPPEVETGVLADGRAALRVLDRGPGVPPRAAKKIFERFYRADDATTSETGGNGLGLSISRRLARGMGGELSYRPRAGGGSVFELTLPAAPAAAPEDTPWPGS